jgi:hypothetical protein
MAKQDREEMDWSEIDTNSFKDRKLRTAYAAYRNAQDKANEERKKFDAQLVNALAEHVEMEDGEELVIAHKWGKVSYAKRQASGRKKTGKFSF